MERAVLDLAEDAATGGPRRRLRMGAAGFGSVVLGVLLGLVLIEIAPPGGKGAPVLTLTLPEASAASLPRIQSGRAGDEAPLVVVDAGHGGFDPGSSSEDGTVEKDVALAIALRLRDRLLDLGAVRVALTREDDHFLPLEERSALAEALGADLFFSIHADSGPVDYAQGANVYLLSRRASDAEALALARSVNEDGAGANMAGDGLGEVETILADLARREVLIDSAKLADVLEGDVRGAMPVHGRFRRSANLVVLRSAEVPSILFEAGYLSSPEDVSRLTSGQGQDAIARALADAITTSLLSR